MDARVIARYAVREILGLAVMGTALFWSAGRIDWWPAWAAMAVSSVAGRLVVVVERGNRRGHVKASRRFRQAGRLAR